MKYFKAKGYCYFLKYEIHGLSQNYAKPLHFMKLAKIILSDGQQFVLEVAILMSLVIFEVHIRGIN